MHKIGVAAKLANTTAHTLRYYEKESMLFPKRDKNNIRIYSELDIMWIKFILKLRSSQMPIKEIKQYTALFKEGDLTKLERLKLLTDHKEKIIAQIDNLKVVDDELCEKIKFYKTSILKDKV